MTERISGHVFHTLEKIFQPENVVSSILPLCIAFILLTSFRTYLMRKWRRQPPGPAPLPIIGNLLHFLSSPHLALQRLGSKYGNVMTISIGYKSVVVVNDIDTMRQALTRKTHDFDGRADSFIGNLVSDGGNDLIFAEYGRDWKMRRKLCVGGLAALCGPRMKNLGCVMSEESEKLVKRILKYDSKAFDPHQDISLAVVNVISYLAFGCRYSKDDPEFLKSIEYIDAIAKGFDNTLGNVIDFFPFLKILPLPGLRNLKMALKIRDDVMSRQLDLHGKDNPEVPDFTSYLLRKSATNNNDTILTHEIEDKHLKLLMFDLFGAGVDTTVVAIKWAFVYLIRWPKCQEVMLKEIEGLRPNKTKIELEDADALPYCQAVVCETLRMCSLFPISPRKAMKDTELLRYRIRKDTDVVFNLWAVNHDEKHWDKPYEFIPERFIGQDGRLKRLDTLSYLPFSAGRRSCPGTRIAEKEIFIMLGTLVQHFEMKQSNELPSIHSVPAVSYKPKPYSVIFTPR